ncbi:alanine racemase [Candidatus Hepatobacter penaei]|uniref:alanine racemase n=1 Tax=Candidatus Hepatobacter penaei TaxID=1274402 RepID=UPI000695AED9|nr:alanine racemase [Candidatus Hepatobacter penaei]
MTTQPSQPQNTQTDIPHTASAVLYVDRAALRTNYQTLDTYVTPSCQVAPVVKTNAYGLGAQEVVATLKSLGAHHFFVATLEEALSLRQGDQDITIYVLNGLWPDVMYEAAHHHITPILSTPEQVAAWRHTAQLLQRSLPCWLQVETGLNRLGLTPDILNQLAQSPDATQGLTVDALMSHLACGYDLHASYNEYQRLLFEQSFAAFPQARKSFANSAGLLHGPSYFYDIARPGRFLYGSMLSAHNPLSAHLRHVITLRGRIMQVRTLKKGEGIGYDQTFMAPRDMRIATVSVGYGDGYFQSLSNKAAGMIGQHTLPVVGRISMDLTTFDVTDVPPQELEQATWMDLINDTLTIDALAAHAQTSVWEILTHLGKRLHVSYVN